MAPQHVSTLAQSHERIYSSQQLAQALRSALAAVREQLQVLSILDSTAMSWPGLQQAVEDLQFLVDMSSKTTSQLEQDHSNMQSALQDIKSESITLKETLAMQNQTKEELQRKLDALAQEHRTLAAQHALATKEVQQQKQVVWTLEKDRADVAAESERYKQDNEFMEGEISSLRSTVAEQMQQLTACKEELAGKRADANHLTQLASDQRDQLDSLKRSLEATSQQLHTTESDLSQIRADKEHFMRQADKSHEEATRLSAELSKCMKEVERMKEWQAVLKRVEGEKLREEQEARAKDHLAAEHRCSALEKTLAKLQADLAHCTERLKAKTTEAESLAKSLSLSGVQARDLQKDVTQLTAEKEAVTRERDEARQHMARMQEALHKANVAAAAAASNHTAQEVKLRETFAEERAKLTASADEARREAAVQKALADGWARDLREAQEAAKEEQKRAADCQSKLEEIFKEQESGKYEGYKSAASAESSIAALQRMVEAKERELTRLNVEFNSERKRLEKHIESLQRECDESAAEIRRLRSENRLPPIGKNMSMQEELESLKRMLKSLPPRVHSQEGLPRIPGVLPKVISPPAYKGYNGYNAVQLGSLVNHSPPPITTARSNPATT